MKSGIARLKVVLQKQYKHLFPDGYDWIQRAISEAEMLAYETPFPPLFFTGFARELITATQPKMTAPSTFAVRA